MTVFNTVAKIGRRFASELNDLIAKVLEESKFSNTSTIQAQAIDKGRWNTVNKIKRRKVNDLQGLKMSVIQESFREYNSSVDMRNTSRDTTNFNLWSKLIRRKYSEVQGLLVDIVENSKRTSTVKAIGFKLIKPLKTYKNKIKLLFKYSNKTKY